MKQTEIETLLTAKEVSARWKICTRTLRRWAEKGIIRPVRFSARCVRYSVSDVAAALARVGGQTQLKTVVEET